MHIRSWCCRPCTCAPPWSRPPRNRCRCTCSATGPAQPKPRPSSTRCSVGSCRPRERDQELPPMAYDPQRNRPRAQPSGDQPAPVDMVLEGVVPVEAVEAVEVAAVAEAVEVVENIAAVEAVEAVE